MGLHCFLVPPLTFRFLLLCSLLVSFHALQLSVSAFRLFLCLIASVAVSRFRSSRYFLDDGDQHPLPTQLQFTATSCSWHVAKSPSAVFPRSRVLLVPSPTLSRSQCLPRIMPVAVALRTSIPLAQSSVSVSLQSFQIHLDCRTSRYLRWLLNIHLAEKTQKELILKREKGLDFC